MWKDWEFSAGDFYMYSIALRRRYGGSISSRRYQMASDGKSCEDRLRLIFGTQSVVISRNKL